MTAQEIIATLHGQADQLTFMMNNRIVYESPMKRRAIEKIEAIISRPKSEVDLCKELVQSRCQVLTIMPPRISKYKNVREKMLAILSHAEAMASSGIKISDLLAGA
jgi:hypothetical protein